MPLKKKVKPGAVTKVTPKQTSGDKPTYTEGQSLSYEGYCVKCKEKGVKINGTVSASPNGTLIAKGPHGCGTTVCRILGKPKS